MYFVFTIELNLLLPCFGLSALYLRIYWNSWPSPPRRPSIPQVRQGSVRFNSNEEEPPPLPFSLLAVYLFYDDRIHLIHYSSTVTKIIWISAKKRACHVNGIRLVPGPEIRKQMPGLMQRIRLCLVELKGMDLYEAQWMLRYSCNYFWTIVDSPLSWLFLWEFSWTWLAGPRPQRATLLRKQS